ncbi:hypothetical protein Pth03_09940 [Planotetraspora thailandica]|uniref:Uncharacterized protein n=1 Tax=Planotetraspora thailandica TaxID=487172 RepID=A0A8J3V9M9_9ACTN|nr:hypothetical protein [Planotetraspora thailandica]GII52605.1 hypothetical protein Pth03_09940 [Planotetraspora thailandica]
MPDFLIDYDLLHEARKDLHDLADRISPALNDSVFSQLGRGDYGDAGEVFGNEAVTGAFRSLYRFAQDPMNRAKDHLTQLGDIFGSVADAFFDADSQIAEGLGVMGSRMGLDDWRNKKDAWDYRNAHADECVPNENGDMPGFCGATDPGPPPTDLTYTTDGGQTHTHLTLDENYNVVKEETTVTHNGQTYTSVTTYSDGGKSYTTDTTFSNGSTTHAETHLNDDGSGTMTVTDGDGKKTEYHRDGSGKQWEQVGGDDGDNGDDDGPPPLPQTPVPGGSRPSF